MRRFVVRFLQAAVLVSIAAVALGLAYAPARPVLRDGLSRVGLDKVGRALFGAPAGMAGQADAPALPADAAAPPLPPAVTVVQATSRDFRDRLFVSGSLVARDEALVGPQLDGLRITSVSAEDGDTVRRGTVLATLDRSQLDAQLAESDATLARADASIAQAENQITQFDATSAQAGADLTRARRMETGTLSQSTLDQRVATSRSAEAQLAAARSALAIANADKASQIAQRRELEVRIGRTDVRAPVDGVISRRSARLGALAMSSGDPLFRIIAGGQIDLDAEATDEVLARVRLGMPATITLQGAEDKVAGAVRLISAEVDKASRLGHVRIAVPDGASGRIGSFASARIEVARRQGVGVPASAITTKAGARSVEVVMNGRIDVRPVEVGMMDGPLVEVTSGLVTGDTVVARASAFLRGGDLVRPMPAQQEAQR